jgi:hypothetical protein
MNPEAFRHLIESVTGAQEEELMCSRFFELLPRFVDLRLSSGAAEAALPEVAHHMRQCPECHEVYLAVLAATAADASSPE